MSGRFYEVPCVSSAADDPALRTAYQRAALLAHPDKGDAREEFQLVALSLETLSKQASDETYDRCRISPGQRIPPSEKTDSHNCKRRSSSVSDAERRNVRTRQGANAEGANAELPREDTRRQEESVRASRRSRAMERLRCVLQSFDGARRREAMAHMQPRVQRALLAHMQAQRGVGDRPKSGAPASHRDVARVARSEGPKPRSTQRFVKADSHRKRCPQSGVAGVHRIGTSYRASIAVANLEIFSRVRPSVEAAIEDRIILVQIQDAIFLTMGTEATYTQHLDQTILEACRACLAEHNTSERDLQLRAKFRVRATQCFGSMRISSPALSFEEAIRLRSKLFRSKQSSWQSFRAECIELLQRERHFHGRRLQRTLEEADGIAEKAWTSAASRRHLTEMRRRRLLKEALRRVAAVLDVEERRRVLEQARLRVVAIRNAKANQRRAQVELRRWYRRSDNTMEEIIRGPPVHLRQIHVQKTSG